MRNKHNKRLKLLIVDNIIQIIYLIVNLRLTLVALVSSIFSIGHFKTDDRLKLIYAIASIIITIKLVVSKILTLKNSKNEILFSKYNYQSSKFTVVGIGLLLISTAGDTELSEVAIILLLVLICAIIINRRNYDILVNKCNKALAYKNNSEELK